MQFLKKVWVIFYKVIFLIVSFPLAFIFFVLNSYAFTQVAMAAANLDPLSTNTVSIANVEYTISDITPTLYIKLTAEQQKNVATEWHLSVDDYSHYLWLMSNTANAVYYKDKNLDPSWILGFNAKDDKERQKFVAISIENERARVAKELLFQQEFDRLQRQLYPDLAPIVWNPKDQ